MSSNPAPGLQHGDINVVPLQEPRNLRAWAGWAGILGLWSERRLRRSIVGRLKSLFEAALAHDGEQARAEWASDYGLGFISMLVFLVARRSQPGLDSEALGRLQVACWADLTGIDSAEVATRITLLSAGRDSRFGEGCRAALTFESALRMSEPPSELEHLPELPGAEPNHLQQALWHQVWQGR